MHPRPFTSLHSKQWCGHRLVLELWPQPGIWMPATKQKRLLSESGPILWPFLATDVAWITAVVQRNRRPFKNGYFCNQNLPYWQLLCPSIGNAEDGLLLLFFASQQLATLCPSLGMTQKPCWYIDIFFPFSSWEKFDPAFSWKKWKCVGTFPR